MNNSIVITAKIALQILDIAQQIAKAAETHAQDLPRWQAEESDWIRRGLAATQALETYQENLQGIALAEDDAVSIALNSTIQLSQQSVEQGQSRIANQSSQICTTIRQLAAMVNGQLGAMQVVKAVERPEEPADEAPLPLDLFVEPQPEELAVPELVEAVDQPEEPAGEASLPPDLFVEPQPDEPNVPELVEAVDQPEEPGITFESLFSDTVEPSPSKPIESVPPEEASSPLEESAILKVEEQSVLKQSGNGTGKDTILVEDVEDGKLPEATVEATLWSGLIGTDAAPFVPPN